MQILKDKASTYTLKTTKSEFNKVKIRSSADCYEFIKQFYGDDIEIMESFFLVLLNRANTTIGWVKISQGGLTGTVADPRIIAKYAVDSLACAVILAHNHPSGNLQPSEQDNLLTKKIKGGLQLLDIQVLDHIILTETAYYSFADEGQL